MSRKFYILNHPEREFAKEQCTFLEKQGMEWVKRIGEAIIPVDHINSVSDNQDPYVFHMPWLYGYCKNALLENNMAGDGSGIIFGKYHRKSKEDEQYKFLIDTIFISQSKFDWKDKHGYSPSINFTSTYPTINSGKHYRNFVAPRTIKGQHMKAKSIFVAKHLELKEDMVQININSNEDYFSCIPLYKNKNGEFMLIDILPAIEKNKSNMFENYSTDRRKLYDIEVKLLKEIYEYVLKEANILVIKTSGQALLDEANIELNEVYIENIYGAESKKRYLKNKNRPICPLKKE